MNPAETRPLQLILPTDKRNPSFSLYLSADEKEIHVFYGLELLEVVPADRDHVAYKLLVARLYNAGLRVQTLAEVFQLDPKTMRAWGGALRSRNPAQLQRMLLGSEAGRKRTAAIVGYVRQRWPQLLDEGCRNYREKLQQEIQRIFDTRLSGETLRVLMAQIRAEGASTPNTPAQPELPAEPRAEPPPAVADLTATGQSCAPLTSTPAVARGVSTAADEVVRSTALREPTCSDPAEQRAEDPPVPPSADFTGVDAVSGDDLAAAPAPASSNPTPSFWAAAPGASILCDHAGLLLFARALGSLPGAVEPREPLLAQWLGSVLLGAANVEQTKYLNWDDLSLLLGSVVRFPTTQRDGLQRLATPATVEAVLRWNLQQLGPAAVGTDFYLDPHTQHYTGMQPVLKGWCAAIRWADKLVNSDFVHTAQGDPIYFECTDNYDDLRARFAPLIRRLRATLQWEPERVLTFVVDRGIYSNEVFAQVIADPAVHLITWQKGYVAEPWDAAAVSGAYGLEKVRNNAQDVRLYRFSYHDRIWAQNPALRQIVVCATNPAGETDQLAILTDDLTRSAEAIVRLMFNRYGLGAIKGVGEAVIQGLLEERRRDGSFTDLFELCRRMGLRKLNRRVLESLIRSGTLDALGSNRATLMAQLPDALQMADQHSRNDAAGQNDLFGLAAAEKTPVQPLPVVKTPDESEDERLRGEKETLGIYLSGHPITRVADELAALHVTRLGDLAGNGNGNGTLRRGNDRAVLIAGLVVSVRTRNANRGGRMAFVTLDDGSGRIEIRLFPEVYERHRLMIIEDAILVAQGGLGWDEFNQTTRLNVERVLDLDGARAEYAHRLLLRVDAGQCAVGILRQLAGALTEYRVNGHCPVWVEYWGGGARVELALGPPWRVRPGEALLKRLRELTGPDRVRLLYDSTSTVDRNH